MFFLLLKRILVCLSTAGWSEITLSVNLLAKITNSVDLHQLNTRLFHKNVEKFLFDAKMGKKSKKGLASG